jgi:hypothetical protein
VQGTFTTPQHHLSSIKHRAALLAQERTLVLVQIRACCALSGVKVIILAATITPFRRRGGSCQMFLCQVTSYTEHCGISCYHGIEFGQVPCRYSKRRVSTCLLHLRCAHGALSLSVFSSDRSDRLASPSEKNKK